MIAGLIKLELKIYKYECNEKFWSNKTTKLQEEILQASKENKSLKTELKLQNKEQEKLKREFNEIHQQFNKSLEKKEKKEE